MASMALPNKFPYHCCYHRRHRRSSFKNSYPVSPLPRIVANQNDNNNTENGEDDNLRHIARREIVLRCSRVAVVGAVFNFSGSKPDYLGVQRNTRTLALCPATKNCISTAENVSDLTHYAPPWTYNPEGGRGGKRSVTREEAMEELLQVIRSTKPDKFTPQVVERKDDYIHVEYQSPILGLVDDVEFWFPPNSKSIVEYRSASRLGNFDFDVNRKRIKALRLELEKKGWASEGSF